MKRDNDFAALDREIREILKITRRSKTAPAAEPREIAAEDGGGEAVRGLIAPILLAA